MNNEVEAQFLGIDKEAMREKLRQIGAELVKPEITFEMEPPDWARERIR